MAVYGADDPPTPVGNKPLLLTGTAISKALVSIEPKSNNPASFGTNSTKRAPIPGNYEGG